jgi:hypothetical protein
MPYFVRIVGDPRLYLVDYGERRWIPDDTTWYEFCQWRGIDFADRYVREVESPDLYPLGMALDHVIRERGTPEVYYVPRGTYAGRGVPSPWALVNWGLVGDVIDLDAEDMARYTTDGPAFHPGQGGEGRPRVEVLSFPKWVTGNREDVVWTVREGRDVVVHWRLANWFTDTDTELRYRVDGGVAQKTPTQHGGNQRYQATIPGELLMGSQRIDMWIRAAERGKGSGSDDPRLEFCEPDVDAGFAPLSLTVTGGKQHTGDCGSRAVYGD